MARACTVKINRQTFQASAGDVLLDAALNSGVNIPHDCRAGLCGNCLIRVVQGSTLLGESHVSGMVYACLTRLISDLEVETEDMPEVSTVSAEVESIVPLASDVVEVVMTPSKRLQYRPGQYYKFKFEGLPVRSFSPTLPLDRPPYGPGIALHVRKVPGGRVSSELGRTVKAGHSVTVTGPFGRAYFRPNKAGRTILIAGGTGFAPIWNIAYAALKEDRQRPIELIVGSRTATSLYMAPGLARIVQFPNVRVTVAAEKNDTASSLVRPGYPTDYLPRLRVDDVIYAAGSVPLIEKATSIAVRAGIEIYSDPFEPANGTDEYDLIDRARRLKRLLIQRYDSRFKSFNRVQAFMNSSAG